MSPQSPRLNQTAASDVSLAVKIINKGRAVSIAAAAVASALVLSSCGFEHAATGPMRDEPVEIDLASAERANIELDIGAGQLNLKGDSDKLVSGDFEYNVDSYKPVVHSSLNGTHAVVTIRQPSHNGFGGHVTNTWNLRLNNKALLDLALNCGAGQAELNLGTIAIRTLEVHMGAGQVDLDLRGHPARDYEVNISGGVGQATVRLPQEVGIRADAHGGIGSINVSGLRKVGDHYENDLYDKTKVNLRLSVAGGIGEIRIIG
jgi:hypothetical protein